MNGLNFHHLHYFYHVAMNQSIKETASLLHVSQPTISDQIKLLEEFLETKLFERKHRALYLTTAGEELFPYAEKVFNLSKEIVHTFKFNNRIKQSIDIGMTPFMTRFFKVEYLDPLFDRNILLKTHEEDRLNLLVKLEKGELDFVYTDNPEVSFSHVDVLRIGENKSYICVHKDFKKYLKNYSKLVSELKLITYTEKTSFRKRIEHFLTSKLLTARTMAETDDEDLISYFLTRKKGFAFVPENLKNKLKKEYTELSFKEIIDLKSDSYLIYLKNYKGIGMELIKAYQ